MVYIACMFPQHQGNPLTAHMDIEDEATPAEAFELVPKFVSQVLPQLVMQEMKQQRESSN